MKIKYPDRDIQCIYYAKGWYKETNVIEDLRTIYCKCNKIDYVNDEDIWKMLIHLARIHPDSFVKNFMNSIFNGQDYIGLDASFDFMRGNKPVDLTFKRAIYKILSWLRHLTVQQIEENLGETFDGNPVDEDILPLKHPKK